jgi:hypothetical protein
VTDHEAKCGSRPLTVAGVPVHARLDTDAPELARWIVRRLVEEVPFYRLLPEEQIRGEVAEVVVRSLRLLATVVRDRRAATDDELVFQRDSAARRAEEGVPLDAVLSAYHLGMTISWNQVTAAAEPADLADVQAALAVMLRLHQQITAAVSAAYVEERHVIDSQAHSGRRTLLGALAGGAPPATLAAVAQEAGVRVAPHYAVLRLAFGPHPDDAAEGTGAAAAKVTARRRLRRLQAALDRFAREPVLSALEPLGGTVLLPLRDGAAWPELRTFLTHAGRELGLELTAAAAVASPAGVPDALRQAGEIAALVRRSGRQPGLYLLSDVLLEYQLSRPSDAHPALAALLDPLAGKADLLRTLEEFLRSGLSRRRTAATLHVHPNTVDYRIKRVAQLTGLNPARPADLQHLSAALVARQVLRAAP